MSSSNQPAPILKGAAAETLLALQEDILLTFVEKVRQNIQLARAMSQPVIVDTLPLFLVNLAEALAENHPRELATESTTVAQEHGGERARVTRYGPDQIILEYQILRDIVYEKLEKKISLTNSVRSIIQRSFDQGIQEAMMAYFLVHGRVRDQFVATLSHDLRNPLGASKMAAELIGKLLASPTSDGQKNEVQSLTSRIVANIKRADRMIQNLLDTNFMQLGERLQLNLQKCDAYAIVLGAVAELPASDRKRLVISGSPVECFWDSDGIQRAIENLIANAFKYGDELKPVSLGVTEILGRIILTVHNAGNPIPAEEQEYLFQPFRRSESAKASGKRGWGIGLALARGVAESHGGSVGLDSSPELGTTFHLDIPADARPFLEAPVTP